MSTSLIDLSITEMLSGLRSGAISSRELTQAVLDRIHAVEPKVRAYLTLVPSKLWHRLTRLMRVWRSTEEQERRSTRIVGLPIAVKDLLTVRDCAVLRLEILENFVPPFTATSIQHLLDAGSSSWEDQHG